MRLPHKTACCGVPLPSIPGELRVFQLDDGDVRACIVPSHLAMSHNMMDEKSEPVAQAYLDALALCEKEGVTTLWVHDSLGLFPPHDRPERKL
jgi:hypothetical protein